MALRVLDDRERQIFEGRRLFDPPRTLEELATRFGISRERIRQIEDRAFRKVQRAVHGAMSRTRHSRTRRPNDVYSSIGAIPNTLRTTGLRRHSDGVCAVTMKTARGKLPIQFDFSSRCSQRCGCGRNGDFSGSWLGQQRQARAHISFADIDLATLVRRANSGVGLLGQRPRGLWRRFRFKPVRRAAWLLSPTSTSYAKARPFRLSARFNRRAAGKEEKHFADVWSALPK